MPKNFTSVHYGDVHFPFQDDRALAVLYRITETLKPDLVACHGDLLDCYSVSSFAKDLHLRPSLGEEIALAHQHLDLMEAAAPKARRLLLEGNHENRLAREVRRMAARPEALEILKLPGVANALSWQELLCLDNRWEWHDKRTVLFDKLILKHGDVVRKFSGYTAKAEQEKYHKGGISGHTHRRGVFEHTDWNGVHAWWEHGCLCDLNPDYVTDPNWQQGFLVVTWSDDRSSYGVEEVRIHDGSAFFRGKLFSAD